MADTKMHVGIEVTSWINILAGLGIAASPYFSPDSLTTFQLWATVVVGLAIAVLAGYDAWVATTGKARNALIPSVVNLVLGAGIAFDVWYVGATGAYLWMAMGGGIVVALLAIYDVYASSRTAMPKITA